MSLYLLSSLSEVHEKEKDTIRLIFTAKIYLF